MPKLAETLDGLLDGRRAVKPVRTALYRHFNARGRLLYVGISADPFRRLRQHMRRADWRDEVVKITVERFRSREHALTAEFAAIQSERPKHNIAHRAARKPSKRASRSVRRPLLGTPADRAAYHAAMAELLRREPTTLAKIISQ